MAAGEGAMTQDPVCNGDIEEREAIERGFFCRYGSETYYFCSIECLIRFRQRPEDYMTAPRHWRRQTLPDDYPDW